MKLELFKEDFNTFFCRVVKEAQEELDKERI